MACVPNLDEDGDEGSHACAEHPPRQVPRGRDGAEREREHPAKPGTHALPDRARKIAFVTAEAGVRIDGQRRRRVR